MRAGSAPVGLSPSIEHAVGAPEALEDRALQVGRARVVSCRRSRSGRSSAERHPLDHGAKSSTASTLIIVRAVVFMS